MRITTSLLTANTREARARAGRAAPAHRGVLALMLALLLLTGGAVEAHAAPDSRPKAALPCGISPTKPCPLTLTQQFGAASIPLNGSTTLTFRISHTSDAGLPISGIGFIDTLPPGLIVATPSGLSSSCDG